MSADGHYASTLSGLPADWGICAIRDLGEVISGGTPSRANPSYWGGNIPWATPGQLQKLQSKWLTTTDETITEQGLAESGARLLPPRSLLVTTRATLGARALNAVPAATNQGFKSVVFSEPDAAHYYYYWTEHLVPELERRASGTTFLEISGGEFSQVEVPDPPQDERSKIAQILDTLDTQIRRTEEVIAKLEQVKQGLLTDLLTRGIDENGELRPPPETEPSLYKDSVLGQIPNEWEPTCLGKLVKPTRPIVYGILMPGTGHENGVPVVKVKDIAHGFIKSDNLLLTHPDIDREYARSRLHEGDLLFTIRGTVGRTAIVPPKLKCANITQDTARISLASNFQTFVRSYLGMPRPKAFIEAHTLGVAVRGINLRDVRRVPVAQPPLHEAEEISSRIESIDRRLSSERETLTAAQLLKTGLMEDLLTGRVRVTPLLDEASQATS